MDDIRKYLDILNESDSKEQLNESSESTNVRELIIFLVNQVDSDSQLRILRSLTKMSTSFDELPLQEKIALGKLAYGLRNNHILYLRLRNELMRRNPDLRKE